jgi:hypothetical protein
MSIHITNDTVCEPIYQSLSFKAMQGISKGSISCEVTGKTFFYIQATKFFQMMALILYFKT